MFDTITIFCQTRRGRNGRKGRNRSCAGANMALPHARFTFLIKPATQPLRDAHVVCMYMHCIQMLRSLTRDPHQSNSSWSCYVAGFSYCNLLLPMNMRAFQQETHTVIGPYHWIRPMLLCVCGSVFSAC